MSVKPVSLFFGSKINSNAAANSEQAQNPVKAFLGDKKAAAIGGVAALAILGTVAAVAIKRHKAPNEIKIALDNLKATNETVNSLVQSVQKQADEITQYAKKVYGEVTELFEKGEEIAPDGTVLRKITGDDTKKIMEEFTQDGEITRKSSFVDNALENVREGIEELADGTTKTAKEISFSLSDGKIIDYAESIEELADGSYRAAKEIEFKEGKVKAYTEGLEACTDCSYAAQKGIFFEDEAPMLYRESYVSFSNGSQKAAREIGFVHNRPNWYIEGNEEFADGSYKRAKILDSSDNNLDYYCEGYEKFADGSEKIVKEYKLTKEGWQAVIE